MYFEILQHIWMCVCSKFTETQSVQSLSWLRCFCKFATLNSHPDAVVKAEQRYFLRTVGPALAACRHVRGVNSG
jgi:hypothetical protein